MAKCTLGKLEEKRMSHHLTVYDKEGEALGHLRITNDGIILSAWICRQMLKPELPVEEE